MRAALYARFSTDLQSASSLADQFRICETKAPPELTIVARHGDEGVSGSIPVARRPGGKALMEDAFAGRFEVLLMESLDRLSRDQVELERVVRRLEHIGIRIIGISDGYDSKAAGRKVIRAVRGIVAELYLDDLRAKTHRGLTGRIQAGFIASGKSFGYQIVRSQAGSRYQIDEAEAQVVRRIFDQFADGLGVNLIAYGLNADGIASPRGGSWAVSAIYGSPIKGSGILNNRLYVGRMVWNRSQWIKDPDSGKRSRVNRPPSDWQVVDVPELRIVDDGVWQAVRRRIDFGRDHDGRKQSRRPSRTLFSGILRCPFCGGTMTAINSERYGCSMRKDRGPAVCKGLSIRRRIADEKLLEFIRGELLSPANAREYETAFMALERDAPDPAAQNAAKREKLKQEIARLVDAIATVGASAALAERLRAAEGELQSLTSTVQIRRRALAPGDIAKRFKAQLAQLEAELRSDPERAHRMIQQLIPPIPVTRDPEGIVWGEIAADCVMGLAVGESLIVGASPRNQHPVSDE